MNIYLWISTFILLIFSFIKSKEKTKEAIKMASKRFMSILSLFILVLAGFALLVTFVPAELLQKYIGSESGIKGIAISLGFGSISVMPGFAAFPLCAAFKSQGIPYYIIAAFSLSLMNVGIVSFPLEKKYLGLKTALFRNLLSLVVCIIVVIVVKIIFAE